MISAWRALSVVSAALVLMMGLDSASGTTPTIPAVTNDTLPGIWEATTPDGPAVLRLDVRKKGPSYVAIATGDSDGGEAAVFQIDRVKLDGGAVELMAHDLTANSSYSLVVTGNGRAGGGGGKLDATVVLRDETSNRFVRQWKSIFVLTSRGYVRDLGLLSAAAARRIKQSELVRSSENETSKPAKRF